MPSATSWCSYCASYQPTAFAIMYFFLLIADKAAARAPAPSSADLSWLQDPENDK